MRICTTPRSLLVEGLPEEDLHRLLEFVVALVQERRCALPADEPKFGPGEWPYDALADTKEGEAG